MTNTLVRRTDVLLRADPRRVVAQLFLPGQEVAAPGRSRAAAVVDRCLAMNDDEAGSALASLLDDFSSRHRHFTGVLDAHFAAIAHRVEDARTLPTDRQRLIGAAFTMECAVEAAALFNPSVVAHPLQDAADGLRFVLSARAVSEGHISGIVFGSGLFTDGPRGPAVSMDARSPRVSAGLRGSGPIVRDRLARQAAAMGADEESLMVAFDGLPEQPSADALEAGLQRLHDQRLTRGADATIDLVRRAADSFYQVSYDADTELSERALLPGGGAESHGLEDARFVRFIDDDGSSTYLATYTAYDGSRVSSSRLQTDDFSTFRASPLTGRAAGNKGMALFPRRVGGRYLALSRWDRENNAIAVSPDGHHWPEAVEIQAPDRPWEVVQLGNCGSPIETDQGWLVLTHGVGLMRRYVLGAALLDLDDPRRVLGCLREPLLLPTEEERDGYVPNVVYSCGALQYGRTLLMPYGCSDATIRMALVDVPELLALLAEG